MASNPFDAVVDSIPRGRASPGTAQDLEDVRDDILYSAALLQHGGTGPVQMFQQGIGGAISAIKGSSNDASTNLWQTTFSKATTNLQQAGVLGTVVGNVAIYAIGLDLEQAKFLPTTGAAATEGATQYELADISAKVAFVLKVGTTKEASSGPFRSYPSLGGPIGSIATTGNNVTVSIASNGVPGTGRKVGRPIKVGKDQSLIGELQVANGSSLVFRTSTGTGNPTLCGCMCKTAAGMDVM